MVDIFSLYFFFVWVISLKIVVQVQDYHELLLNISKTVCARNCENKNIA